MIQTAGSNDDITKYIQEKTLYCWKLYNKLIILNLIDIYMGFCLFIHN